MAGQRIVARLRERTYVAALKQEVEFVERGEGDILSRLSVDSSIVGERYDEMIFRVDGDSPNSSSVTRDLSDGLRAVVMASAGRTYAKFASWNIPHHLISLQSAQCFTFPPPSPP